MMKKYLLIIFLAALLIALILGVIWVRKNTSLLNLDIDEEEIAKNNSNDKDHLDVDLNNLISQKIVVPDKFKVDEFKENRFLNLPADFTISIFSAGLSSPRFFDFDDNNLMYLADKGTGSILTLPDTNSDGVSDAIIEIDTNLKNVHSVDWYKGDLFIAEEDKVSVYKDIKEDGSYSEKKVLVDNLPDDGGHVTRTVVIGPDEKMYVSVGSSCNLCEENDERRAAIMQYDLDGSNGKVYASGLRNTVGFIFNDNQIFGADMGRDLLGDDLPPEEINIIEKGKHYGWPYCYGDQIANPEYSEREDFCKNETQKPLYQYQAHSAPLGIAFTPEDSDTNFPNDLASNLFVAFHGSWNRTTPTGDKIVRFNENGEASNFITGWLQDNGDFFGRPAGLAFDNNGVMYISDDQLGVIYRVEYRPRTGINAGSN